ncbi:MAG: adenylosuccinate lyase [Caldilineaceae bacterium]|nr:adenylosuccinate lyase [Caldilineaceae bacterium]
MTETFSHDTFISPLSWRYGSRRMRAVWSEVRKRKLLRQFWVALAKAQAECGVVTWEQARDLEASQDDVDLRRAAEIEAEVRHDLVAEIRTFAEQCPLGGGIIHLGATSNDALDNVDALRMRESLGLVERRLADLLATVADRIEQWADVPVMAFTHIQPAEPTTAGYRIACFGQDLLMDFAAVQRERRAVKGKGVKGAVGTAAPFAELLTGTGWTAAQLEQMVMRSLGLEAFTVATQTMPRKQELQIAQVLSGIAGSLHKFALDSRILQSRMIGEWSEEFGEHQVGSSAMPFKRNPIAAENICSLARQVSAQVSVAWQNHANAILERTLDDSGNRRLFLPELFLLTDEILRRAGILLKGLSLDRRRSRSTLDGYGQFAASERVLLAAVRAGGNRQVLHEVLRRHCMTAWSDVEQGRDNRLSDLLVADPDIRAWLLPETVHSLMSVDTYLGDAPARARAVGSAIRRVAGNGIAADGPDGA